MSHSNKSGFRPQKTLAAIAVGAALMLSMPAALAADGSTIKGHIVNSQGSSLSNATITLKHKSKGLVFTVETNDKGNYSLRNIPVGQYDVTITKDGFTVNQELGLDLRLGQPTILDGQLNSISSNDVERIEVTGSMIRRVDMSSSTSGVTFSQDELDKMPVDSGFNNIALLAPGTAKPGGSNFNNASSFGGSSSAENAYYLNGLNITGIKTGLGSLTLPWEAIGQTEIKTGGISAEYGGALGGIVNAVSKTGDNDFKFGGQLRYDPSSLRETHDPIYDYTGTQNTVTAQDSEDYRQAQIWASGAIIEDTLFFYGLYEPATEQYNRTFQTTRTKTEYSYDRWFVKADWFVTEDHSIGFMAMNNERTWEKNTYAYDWETQVTGDKIGVTSPGADGGKLYSINYKGYFTDALSVSAVVGQVEEEENTIPGSSDPFVSDRRSGSKTLSAHTNSTIYKEKYTRDQARIDFNLDLENHQIAFGLDYTNVDVNYLETANGIDDARGWWYVRTAGDGSVSGAPSGTDYIERRRRDRFTDSDTTNMAYYINDSWQATDNLVVNMGVRVTNTENSMSDGQKYVDFKNQIAPRLQGIYDLHGDGSAKVFATYGRYFQPVSANMNITQGGSATDLHDYFALDQLDGNGAPVLQSDGSPSHGAAFRDTEVGQDSRGLPAAGIASTTLEPMYSDEITIGYQQDAFETMSFGARVIWRDLGRGVEDSDITTPLNKKLAELGYEDVGGVWFLHNPGQSLTIGQNFDGSEGGDPRGSVEYVTLSAQEMALDTMERHYLALELTLEGAVTDNFRMNASYTLSKNWGNTEGLVKTDNDQADPGWTTSYDYGDLMDHGYGLLPNDHTHVFKFNGTYDITESLILGFVTSISSGRPQSYLGRHPEGVDSCTVGNVWDACEGFYGHSSFYDENEQPAKRGSKGNLDWNTNLDLSLMYIPDILDGGLSLKATIYNVFNSDAATNIEETRTTDTSDNGGFGLNQDYGMVTERQEARYVSFVARYEF